MVEFEKFRSILFQLIREMIGSKLEEADGRVEENLAKELLDIETNHVGIGKWSKRENFLMEIFHGFVEIDSSFMTLKDIEVYIERFPYRRISLSKTRYVQYHVTKYLEEMYILKLRLIAYMKKINRLYKKHHRKSTIEQLTKEIEKNVEDIFKGIKGIRHGHTHVSRYRDRDLIRFGALESLMETSDENFVKVLNLLYQGTYRKIRNEWENTIKKNNEKIRKSLNIYCYALSKILFDHKGMLICPYSL